MFQGSAQFPEPLPFRFEPLHYRGTRSGRNTRTFVGSYDFHLLRIGGRWRIDSFRFNLKFLDGNLELEQAE